MATIRPFSDALLELSTDGLTWIDVTPFGIGLGTVRLAQAIPLVDFGRGSRQVAQRKSPKQAYSLPFSLEVNETTLPWLHLGHGAQRYVRWSSEGNGTESPGSYSPARLSAALSTLRKTACGLRT